MAATIYDVARLARVGLGTVSRVLNNSPSVKPATRARVVEAIAQLDYSPDPIARSMLGGHTRSFAVIAPFFTRPFSIEVLKGIEATTTRQGYELIIYNVETEIQGLNYFSRLPMRRKVDGLVILSLSPEDKLIPSFHKAKLPTVLIDAFSSHLTSIVINNVEGAYNAINFLIDHGHRRIGFINGVNEWDFKFNQASERLSGVRQALDQAGLNFEPALLETSDWSREGGRAAALKLLTLDERPTAIFAASDIQALGVLEVARSRQIRVPDELSIIGFDGIELSELLELSTIQQPLQLMGELGITKLIELIQTPARPPEVIRLDTRLVKRSTTGPYTARQTGSASPANEPVMSATV